MKGRAGARTRRRAVAIVVLLLGTAAAPALAQRDTLVPRPDTLATSPDSILAHRTKGDSIRPRPPITPGQAFLRSLVLPGWGQASLHRNVTGGVFASFEGIALTMVWKSGWQLDFARVRGRYVKSHTQEQQDWIVLLVFNHLMAGAEAFVSAHLYDFPVGLRMQRLPGGATGVGVRVDF